MGTSTIFRRHNDLYQALSGMSKGQLASLDKASPWRAEQDLPSGWSAPLELHNGNVHVLVWWYGRLMRLEDAPKQRRNITTSIQASACAYTSGRCCETSAVARSNAWTRNSGKAEGASNQQGPATRKG
ncbi:hypothetical protein HZC09_03785 [Candidatus Micrarchaeota archaeon]|nr:hypothetical protein [Candidatus Micrarchaeota archaeon]